MNMRIDKIKFLDTLLHWGILLFCGAIPFSIAASQIGIIVALISWGLLSIIKRKLIWKKNVMTIPIVIFLFTQFLSILFSIDVGRSIHEFRSYWHILIFFLVVSCCDKEFVKKCVIVLVVSTVVASCIGCGQYIYTRFLAPALLGQKRISGTMSMYMTYSGILMMVGIVALTLFLYGEKIAKKRLLFCAGSGIIVFALILSLTRSAWLGFVCGVIVIGVMKDRLLLLLLVGSLVAAFIFAPQDVRERAKGVFKGKSTVIEEGKAVNQGDERMVLWKSGLQVMYHYPITGVGLLNFRKAYPQFLSYTPKKNFNHAHNNFIHLGAETGFVGLLAFIMLIGVYLWYIMRKVYRLSITEKSYGAGVAIGVMGAFVAFIIAGLFEYNFGDSEVAMLLWFLMAAPFVFLGSETNNKEAA